MSQNRPTGGSNQGSGLAGTGDTDAGTTRAASSTGGATSGGSGGGSSTGGGSSSSTGGGSQSMTPSTGGGASSGSGQGTGTAAGLATQAQEYGQKIADAASTAKDYVTDKVSVVGDKLKDVQNMDYNEVANQAKDYARQNPGQAILISAAAGLVIGLLVRGSRR